MPQSSTVKKYKKRKQKCSIVDEANVLYRKIMRHGQWANSLTHFILHIFSHLPWQQNTKYVRTSIYVKRTAIYMKQRLSGKSEGKCAETMME